MHFHTLLSKANIMVYTGAIWWPKRGIFINIALYIYTGGICQLQFLNVTLLCLFLCMEQLCKCFRKTNAENQCICDGPCFRRWGGGGGLSSGLSQSGEKAVEQSGGAGSDAPVPSS